MTRNKEIDSSVALLQEASIDMLNIRHNEEQLSEALGLSQEAFHEINRIVSSLSVVSLTDPDITSLSKIIEYAFFKHDVNTLDPTVAFTIGLLAGHSIEKMRSLLIGLSD